MIQILTIATIIWLEMIRRKDVYVLLIMLSAILVILLSMDIFGIAKIVKFALDIGLTTAWLFGWLLTVNISSRTLPQEETRGTIFPLLAKPITRFQLLTGKWLGSWSVSCTATLAFYLLVSGIVTLQGGNLDFFALTQGFLLHCGALSIIAAITIAFSTRMNHDATASLAGLLTIIAFLLVPRIPELMIKETGAWAYALTFLFTILPHFELFDMRQRIVHDFGYLDWKIFFSIIAYGFLLTSVFLSIGWMAYKNKRFTRGNLST